MLLKLFKLMAKKRHGTISRFGIPVYVCAFANTHLFIFPGGRICGFHQILRKLLDPNMNLDSPF